MIRKQRCQSISIFWRDTILGWNIHLCLPFKLELMQNLFICPWRFVILDKVPLIIVPLDVAIDKVCLFWLFFALQLCQIAGGQRYTKKLNERQVTALLRATCQRPSARENNIKQANNLSLTSLFPSLRILIFVFYACFLFPHFWLYK